MSVESTVGRTRYEGNGSATGFPVGFSFDDPAHVRVVLRRPSATVPGTMEDVDLVPDVDFLLTGDGAAGEGMVRYPRSGAPMPEGWTLTIVQNVPLTQERSWSNADAIDVREIEKADDKLTRICQQLKEEVGRCVKVAVTSDTAPADYLDEVRNASGSAQASATDAWAARGEAVAARIAAQSASAEAVSARNAAGAHRTAAQAALAETKSVADAGKAAITDARSQAEHAVSTLRGQAVGDIFAARGEAENAVATLRTQAENAVKATRDAAKADVTETGNQTAAQVRAEGTAQVGQVKAESTAAQRAIANAESACQDRQTILNTALADLIAGRAVGTEGKWRLVAMETVVCDFMAWIDHYSVGPFTSMRIVGTHPDLTMGKVLDYLDSFGVAVGYVTSDSGAMYEVFRALPTTFHIHPKHGDVASDFTAGKQYTVMIFRSSSAPDDQQSGDLDVADIFLGGRIESLYNDEYVAGVYASGCSGWAVGGTAYNNTYDSATNVVTTDPTASDEDSGKTFIYRLATPVTANRVRITGELLATSGAGSINIIGNGPDLHCGYGVTGWSKGSTTTVEITLPTAIVFEYFYLFSNIKSVVDHLRIDRIEFRLVDAPDLSLLAVGDDAVLNPAYWEGKTWKSQLLGDAIFSASIVGLKLARKKFGNAMAVEFLTADRTWLASPKCVWPPSGVGHTEDDVQNKIFFDAGQVYAALGYASAEDMRLNSAVRVRYKTRARVLQPIHYPYTPVVVPWHALYVNGSAEPTVAQFAWNLINSVQTFNSNATRRYAAKRIDVREPTQYVGKVYVDGIVRDGAANDNAVLLHVHLYAQGGTYRVGVLFSELVIDNTRLGFGGLLSAISNVITKIDDNGNTVLCGYMSYDTGIAVA
ncbi:hypothetical protein GGQ74_000322 [Desulfobaculum xiamenense]|uniref:Uncharacterized protein n=1 Tax=Desulfobaculum xiamenense TaxID=995050 RepID=A0A846QJM4_9BACT|nr:hypothetical protein [Desulfobaculum xiamenense]NJB66682.1 hypothetical protein [Desulfobaculum xiamenense]